VLDWARARLDRPLSVADLARQAHLSPRYERLAADLPARLPARRPAWREHVGDRSHRCGTVARMSDWMDDGHDTGAGLDQDYAGDLPGAGHDFASDFDNHLGHDFDADTPADPSADPSADPAAQSGLDGGSSAGADETTTTHTGDATTEVQPNADGSNTVTYDADSDGTPDGIGHDSDGDGVFERVDLDTDHDGTIDATYLDVNHDGKIDAILPAPPAADVNPYLRA
jgi:hypothetical protein